MDFTWTPEQLTLRDAVLKFGRQALQDDVIERDKNARFSRDMWARCAEFGVQGLPFPESYGGRGCDIMSTVLAFETLGYVCSDNGLLFALNAQMWSVQMPIFRFGTEDQKRKYLPRLCDGSWIGAHGMTEPDSGSDAFSLSTTSPQRES